MENTTLEEQLFNLEKDLAAQKASLAREMQSRNREGIDLVPVIEANEIRIEALKTAIKNRDAAAIEREKYLASPEYKKAAKREEELTKELDSKNVLYCQEGNALLVKIQALHALDEELQKLRKKSNPAAAKMLGKGRFTQLYQLEAGLTEAARAGRFYAGVKNIFKPKTR